MRAAPDTPLPSVELTPPKLAFKARLQYRRATALPFAEPSASEFARGSLTPIPLLRPLYRSGVQSTSSFTRASQ
jgi:hypothetical protein